jgi:hypothetical protein
MLSQPQARFDARFYHWADKATAHRHIRFL